MEEGLSSKMQTFLSAQRDQQVTCRVHFHIIKPWIERALRGPWYHKARSKGNVVGNTHQVPNLWRTSPHIFLARLQWRKKWAADYSKCPHIQHLFANCMPLFWNCPKLNTLSKWISQRRKLNFKGILDFHMSLLGTSKPIGWQGMLYIERTGKKCSMDMAVVL